MSLITNSTVVLFLVISDGKHDGQRLFTRTSMSSTVYNAIYYLQEDLVGLSLGGTMDVRIVEEILRQHAQLCIVQRFMAPSKDDT
jgi:hypothetical protein